jgi:hypothetical protein
VQRRKEKKEKKENQKPDTLASLRLRAFAFCLFVPACPSDGWMYPVVWQGKL